MAASSDGPRRPALHLLSVAIGVALCMIVSGLGDHFTSDSTGQLGTALQQSSNTSTDCSAHQLCGLPRHIDARVAAARREYQQFLLNDAQRRFTTKVVRFAGVFLAHVCCHVAMANFASLLHTAGTLFISTASRGGVRHHMHFEHIISPQDTLDPGLRTPFATISCGCLSLERMWAPGCFCPSCGSTATSGAARSSRRTSKVLAYSVRCGTCLHD